MLSANVQQALNDQIKHETYSAYLYLAMSAHFEAQNLHGFAHWMKVQSQEELGHAMKFYGYIQDQGGRVTLQAIDQPPSQFGSPSGIFEQALQHERMVTGLLRSLYELAKKENDYATEILLQWFISEQVEEEKNDTEIIETLKMIGEHGTALFMLGAQLGQRKSG